MATGGVYTGIHATVNAIELISNALNPDSPNLDFTETDKIPNIKGSKNQPLANSVYPVCVGKTLYIPKYFAPYTIPSGIDGQDQKYYCTFLLGYNKLRVSKIGMGSIDLALNNTVDNGKITVNTDYSELYRNNIKLYLEQNEPNNETVRDTPIIVDGDSNLVGTFKVNQQDFSIELLKAEGQDPLNVTKFTNYNPMKIEVEIFFNSLFKYNNEGKPEDRSVDIKVELSYDGGATWFPIGFENQSSSDTGAKCKVEYNNGVTTFTAKKNKNMRFVATHTLSYSDCFDSEGNRKLTNRVVEVRVTRTSDQSTDTKVNDKVYLSAIRTYSYDETKSKRNETLVAEKIQDDIRWSNSSRLSMCINLTDGSRLENFNINEISTVIEPYCRTWNGNEWSTGYSPSSNPASICLMLMQHSMLGKKALKGTRESKIDLLKYGQLYEICENHKSYKTINGERTVVDTPLKCSGVITSKKKLADVLNIILNTARSSLVMNGTRYSVNIDCKKTLPVHILNNHNILADGRNNSKEFKDRLDGLKIKFRNERNDYAQDELKVFYDDVEESDDNILETVNIDYITDPDLVWSYGRYILACYKLRPETWNLKLGVDGKIIEIGSLIEIQDDTISVGIGDGGYVTNVITENGKITGFKIDSEILISEPSSSYAVKTIHIDNNGNSVVTVYRLKTNTLSAGYYNTFRLLEPIQIDSNAISVDDNCSFGFYNLETVQALCTSKTDNGDGTYSMSFIPYSDDVYTADQKTIPEFDSKITNIPQNVGKEEIRPNYVKQEEIQGLIDSSNFTVEIDCPTVYKEGETVTFNFYKVEGGVKTPISVYHVAEYTTNGTTWNIFSGSATTGSSFTTSVLNESIKVRCCIYTDSSKTQLYDQENVSLISDGKDGINGIDGKDGTNGKDGIDGKDGTNGKDGINGTNGKDGTNGTSATNVYLNNENITLACDKDGKLKSAYSSNIKVGAYTGTSRKASTITVSSNTSNVTVGTITNGTTSADGTVPLSMAVSTSATSGVITLSITANSITFTKVINITIAKDGLNGTNGTNGKDGTNGTNGSNGKSYSCDISAITSAGATTVKFYVNGALPSSGTYYATVYYRTSASGSWTSGGSASSTNGSFTVTSANIYTYEQYGTRVIISSATAGGGTIYASNVFSYRGNTGSTGARSIRYLGKSATKPSKTTSGTTSGVPSGLATPIVGDWYLCTNDGYVYYCTAISGSTYTWTYITTKTDYRLFFCVQDLIALSSTLKTNSTLNDVVKDYTSSLATGTLLAQQLFASTITLTSSLSMQALIGDTYKELIGLQVSNGYGLATFPHVWAEDIVVDTITVNARNLSSIQKGEGLIIATEKYPNHYFSCDGRTIQEYDALSGVWAPGNTDLGFLGGKVRLGYGGQINASGFSNDDVADILGQSSGNVFKGNYNAGETYNYNDVVSSSSKLYVSIKNTNKGQAVTNTTYWQPFTQGYVKLSNGLIIQWGSILINTTSPVQLTFPVSTNIKPYIICNPVRQKTDGTPQGDMRVRNITTDSAEIVITNNTDYTTGSYCHWIVIGY